MASASFTLRAVDQTRAAFASVQNSLGRLEKQTMAVAKITKLAFGGEAILGSLNMMKQRLDKVAESGEEMGFSRDQVATAMRMERSIENILNMLMKLPLALGAVGEKLVNTFSPLTDKEIQQRIEELRFERIEKELKSATDQGGKLQKQFDDLGKSEQTLADEAAKAAKELRKQMAALDPEKADDALRIQKLSVEALQNEITAKQINLSLDDRLEKAKQAYGQATAKGTRTIAEQRETLEALRQEYTLLMGAEEKSIVNSSFLNLSKEEQIKKYERFAQVTAQISTLEERLGENARYTAGIIAGGFEDAIFSGEKLRDVIRGMTQDLIRMLFQQQVTSRLAGGFGSLFSGGTFMAGFGGPKAMGGPVSGGKSYVVGEQGPELFVPHASGTIVPNNKMGSGGGGGAGGVTINYNIASGVSRAELVPILDQERRRLKAEIPDMVRRGGAYRAAFA